MTYMIGFILWLAIGIAAAIVVRIGYPGPTTTLTLTLLFAISGAFVGGMLGVAPYVTHDPAPLRFGGLLGAVLGGLLTPLVYHTVARKAL